MTARENAELAIRRIAECGAAAICGQPVDAEGVWPPGICQTEAEVVEAFEKAEAFDWLCTTGRHDVLTEAFVMDDALSVFQAAMKEEG